MLVPILCGSLLFIVITNLLSGVAQLSLSKHQTLKYLSGLLILMSISGFYYTLFFSGIILDYPFVYGWNATITFFYIPLAYFAAKSMIVPGYTMRYLDCVHFIPAVLRFFTMLPIALLPTSEKMKIVGNSLDLYPEDIPGTYNYFFYLSLSLIYIGSITMMFAKKAFQDKKISEIKFPLRQKNLYTIMFTLTLGLLFLVAIVPIAQYLHYKLLVIFIILIFALSITILNLVFLLKPYLLQLKILHDDNKEKTFPKYSKSRICKIDLELFGDSLEKLMTNEKLYCNENLKLGDVASRLSIGTHQLSEYLNRIYGQNFKSWINQYRVNEVVNQVLNENSPNMLKLCLDAGFNSYSAFYNSFREITGHSPRVLKQPDRAVNITSIAALTARKSMVTN